MRSTSYKISSMKLIKHWILEIHLKSYPLPWYSLDILTLHHPTWPFNSFTLFFCRLFFILVPSIHITTFIAYVTSALLPWFPPFLSGHSYTVSTSSWLLLDTCEYLLIPFLPLNYSFSGFIQEVSSTFCDFNSAKNF